MKTLLTRFFFGMVLLVVNISYATAEQKTLHDTDLELSISTASGYQDSMAALINLMGQRFWDVNGNEVRGARVVNENMADYIRIFVTGSNNERIAVYLNTSNLYIDAVGYYDETFQSHRIFFFNDTRLENIAFTNFSPLRGSLRNTSNYNELTQVAGAPRENLSINPHSLESNLSNLHTSMINARGAMNLSRESSRAIISLATIISEALRFPQICSGIIARMFGQSGYVMSHSDIRLTLSWRSYTRAITRGEIYPDQPLTLSDGSSFPQYVPGQRSTVGFLLCSASSHKRSVNCDDSPVDEGFGNYTRYGDYLYKKSELLELTSFIDFYIGKSGDKDEL